MSSMLECVTLLYMACFTKCRFPARLWAKFELYLWLRHTKYTCTLYTNSLRWLHCNV